MKRVKTPTLIQMEMAECGAASLGIILGYFGKYVTLEELRLRCGVSRDGSDAANLVTAAKYYGLVPHAYRKEIDELAELQTPAILFWGFDHFLVLEGIVNGKIYLNDPAVGPRNITFEELDREYTGVAITFEVGPDFKKSGKPASLIKALKSRLKGFKIPLIYLILAGIGLLLPGLALPVLIQFFIDNIFISHMKSWGAAIVMALAFTVLVTGLLTFFQRHYLNRLQQKMSIMFSSQFLWHILRLPITFYDQRFGGEIANRMSLNTTASRILTGNIATTAIDLLLVVFYAALMMKYDVLIASLGICGALINLAAMVAINRSRQNAFACLQQDLGKSIGVSIGALQRIETVKAMGAETDFFGRWAGYYAKTVNANQLIGKKDAFLSSLPIFTQVLTNALLLSIGAWRVLEGKLTIGMLMALQALMFAFLMPVLRFVDFGMLIQELKIMLGRLDDVLQNPVDISYQPKLTHQPLHPQSQKLAGFLEFRNVSFGYSPLAPPLLDDFNYKLSPGQRLALVGPSGCGKSTVAKLTACLQTAWQGEIYFDGKKYGELPPNLFSQSVAMVDQDIFLFAGTIRENLTMWDNTASEATMIQACKDACIHDEIIGRDKGYDSLLNERGTNLSGGQRQRLEIARALIINPTILILDEATSALDSETEKIIINNIYRRGCTCLMIAHRLSTIRECDEIIVFQNGKIVQRGNHEQLKNIEGLYRELVQKENG